MTQMSDEPDQHGGRRHHGLRASRDNSLILSVR